MSGFGNYVGGLFGGELDNSMYSAMSPEDFKAITGKNQSDYYDTINGQKQAPPPPVQLSDPSAAASPNLAQSALDGLKNSHTPGLLPDHSMNESVSNDARALNWESRTLDDLRREKDALDPGKMNGYATAWTDHGNTVKTESETFKKSVNDTIATKWTGDSADAATNATQALTKSAIYEFGPTATAISERFKALSSAFQTIKTDFPPPRAYEDGAGSDNKQALDKRVSDFNSEYHFDGDGRLRNRSGGYVDPSTFIDHKNKIQNEIDDYTKAVQLFRDTYNPTAVGVVSEFPKIPPPPDQTYGAPKPGQDSPGITPGSNPSNPYTGGGGSPSGINTPNTGGGTPSGLKMPGDGKTPSLDQLGGTGTPKLDDPSATSPGKTSPTDPGSTTNSPTSSNSGSSNPLSGATDALSQGLNQGMGALTQGLGSAMQGANQAAQQAANAAQKALEPLREGALGKGLGKGLGGGAHGGGAGAGAGTGGQLSPRLAANPGASLPSSAQTTSSPAAASSSGGVGSPGMGGGGHGARGGEDKEHKANKALKSRKNGSDIVGDSDAFVPVLGADGQPQADDAQQPAPRRRIPQRGTSWQPDAPAQGAQRAEEAAEKAARTGEQVRGR